MNGAQPDAAQAADDERAAASNDDERQTHTGAAQHKEAGDGASKRDPDWGYLPPERVGIAHFKGVVPLSSKKR